jgi:hypothetical protein
MIFHNMVNGVYFKDSSFMGQHLYFHKFHFIPVLLIDFLLEAFITEAGPQCDTLICYPVVQYNRSGFTRFGASPCSGPVTGHLRRRGLGQSAENKGDV